MITTEKNLRASNSSFWWLLILTISAVLVGGFYVLPPALIWHNFENVDKPFVLLQPDTYADELVNYLPRAREAYDGHMPPEGVYAGESGPTVMNPLPPIIFSVFLFLFGGSIEASYLAAQFIFSAMIFLLFVGLGRLLSFSKLWAVFFGLAGVLTQIPLQIFNIFNYSPGDQYWGILFKNFIPIVNSPVHKMFLARLDDPLLTYPVLLLAACSFIYFYRKPTHTLAILAGVFVGLLAYTYLYYWLFWLTVVFLVSLYCLFFDKVKILFFVTFWLVLAIIHIPYFINYINFNDANYSDDYFLRLGTEVNRLLTFKYWYFIVPNYLFLYLPLCLACYFIFIKKKIIDKATGIILLSVVGAMFLVWLIPFVTGFMPHLYHFRKPINFFAFSIIFTLLVSVSGWLSAKRVLVKKFIIFSVIVLMVSLLMKKVVNVVVASIGPDSVAAVYNFSSDISESWSWLNKNIKETVVVSPSLLTSLYLTTYTATRPFLATGFVSTLPTAELERRFTMSNKLFGVSFEVFKARLEEKMPDICPKVSYCPPDNQFNINKTGWYLASHNWPRTLLAQDLGGQVKAYQELSVSWEDTLKYGTSYAYYGPWESSFGGEGFSNKLSLIYKNPKVEIYIIKNGNATY